MELPGQLGVRAKPSISILSYVLLCWGTMGVVELDRPERITRSYSFGLASTARNPIPQSTGIFSFAMVLSEPYTQALYHSAKEVQALAVIVRRQRCQVCALLLKTGATCSRVVPWIHLSTALLSQRRRKWFHTCLALFGG